MGIALLSTPIVVPLDLSTRRLASAHLAVDVLIAAGPIALGVTMLC